MSGLSLHTVNKSVLDALKPPPLKYYLLLMFFSGGIGTLFLAWMIQIKIGMGVSGLNNPVGWAVYIGNFVFWVGIAHSGTLISAILKLVRARWRNAVSRSSEAMTIFAIMVAGMFPLTHLGRVWVGYFILPYPSERHLWPNFVSPLVWDVVAVSTYFTVSTIFFYVGLLPDLAAARDRWTVTHGYDHPRTSFFRILSLGWAGSGNQWLHHGRGYLYFAALAAPLVVSVHSVVSWDFAMALLPGWHTTIFAPYFVAGAIHSGLAMVLTLIIPMSRIFHLEHLITTDHFEAVAKTMLVTTLIVAYAYVIEPFIDWYSAHTVDVQFLTWFMSGWISWIYWVLPLFTVLTPLLFLFRRVRRNPVTLFVISIAVNVGMWLERVYIVVSGTAHDFLPHAWDMYLPSPVELAITAGAFGLFFFLFFVYSKVFPVVPISDYKEDIVEYREEALRKGYDSHPLKAGKAKEGVLAVFDSPDRLGSAVKNLPGEMRHLFETYSPVRLTSIENLAGKARSPVRIWTLVGVLSGITGGLALAAWSSTVNSLVVGGKPIPSWIPFCIVGFEGGVLLGAIFNFIGLILHARLGPSGVPPWYDQRFSDDRYGLFVPCGPESRERIERILGDASGEVRYVTPG